MQAHQRNTLIGKSTTLAAAVSLAAICSAQAAPLKLTYKGYFSGTEALNPQSSASPNFFDAVTPFTLVARFDTSTPNLAPPSPPAPPPFAGFRAYAPSSMTMDIDGTLFSLNGTDNPGLSVSIFDNNSFTPGRYAAGFIVDAAADGAGIIGDFKSASPDFTAAELVPTTFTEFAGVGHSSGVCLVGTPGNCEQSAVTPVVLRDSTNAAWNLTLAYYSMDYPDQPLNAARITAVPEPATFGLMLVGLGLAAFASRARRR
jgi:hypothetical protein